MFVGLYWIDSMHEAYLYPTKNYDIISIWLPKTLGASGGDYGDHLNNKDIFWVPTNLRKRNLQKIVRERNSFR